MLLYKYFLVYIFSSIYIFLYNYINKSITSSVYKNKVIRVILGRICGKTTTYEFEFIVDKLIENKAKKHEFLQVYHKDYGYVLCQVANLTKDIEKTVAKCSIIGYKDPESNSIKTIRTPFMPESEVLLAEDEFIQEILQYNKEKGAFVGYLEFREIPIHLNINKFVTKHACILAKTGAGKSYTVGVLIEEMLDKGIPLLVIDPHGEYSSLKQENNNPFELEKLSNFNLHSKTYKMQVQEYGDVSINKDLKPLKLKDNFTPQELVNLFPRLTSTQQSILYSAIQDLDEVNFENLTEKLRFVDNNAKFTILSVIDYLKKTNLFSLFPTDYNEIIRTGKLSIINLKGIEPEIQQIIVYKLLKDLFQLRKQNKISPFLCIIEEAHNYIPEKHIGEAKSSSIIRTIASEGRKFGLGLCVVSQRPALIEKNVLSQCNTQIILKVTNPNDLKAITSSAEGLTYNAENDIKNLPVGTAMITGFVEMPIFVNIRPRKSKHGGTSIEIVKDMPEPKVLIEEVAEEESVDETQYGLSEDEFLGMDEREEQYKKEYEKEDDKEYDREYEKEDDKEYEKEDERQDDKEYEEQDEKEYIEQDDAVLSKTEKYLTLDEFQIKNEDKPKVELRLNKMIDENIEVDIDEFDDKMTEEQKDDIIKEIKNKIDIKLDFEEKDIVEEAKEYQELLPLIKPKLSKKDLKLISSEPVQRIDTVLIPASLIRCRRKDHEFNILVELVKGKVVEEIDKMKTMEIIDLGKFSIAEVQVLETGLHLYTFTESMITNKTGLGITKVQNILNLLYNEGVLDKNNEYYSISHDTTLISHPHDYSYNEEIKYESVDFNEKEEKIKSVEEIKKKLNQFVDIVEDKDCFIVKYEIVY